MSNLHFVNRPPLEAKIGRTDFIGNSGTVRYTVTGLNISENIGMAAKIPLSSRAYEVPYLHALSVASFAPLLELYEMWRHAPGTIPHINTFKLETISPALIRGVCTLDVEDSGEDFRWTSFGTAHIQRFGTEVTGEMMSTVAERSTSARSALSFAKTCYQEKMPIFFCTEFRRDITLRECSHSILMPLCDDNGTVTRLFGCAIWT